MTRVSLYTGQGFVELVSSMGTDATPARSARVSLDNDTADSTPAKDAKLVKYLVAHEHLSPFEHCVATLRVKVPLFVARQVMRHRTFAFNEVSRRYTDEGVELLRMDALRRQHDTRLQCSTDDEVILDHELEELVEDSQMRALYAYRQMLSAGVAREQARAVLPQSMMTTFWMSGSLRNWAHFLRLRLDAHAQPEAQELARGVASILRSLYPVSLDALLGEGGSVDE
jgi:thymidylate synthase (FAD)